MLSFVGAQCSQVGHGHPWAPDVYGWGVMVINGGLSMDTQSLWVDLVHGHSMFAVGGLFLLSMGGGGWWPVWCCICGQPRLSMWVVFICL